MGFYEAFFDQGDGVGDLVEHADAALLDADDALFDAAAQGLEGGGEIAFGFARAFQRFEARIVHLDEAGDFSGDGVDGADLGRFHLGDARLQRQHHVVRFAAFSRDAGNVIETNVGEGDFHGVDALFGLGRSFAGLGGDAVQEAGHALQLFAGVLHEALLRIDARGEVALRFDRGFDVGEAGGDGWIDGVDGVFEINDAVGDGLIDASKRSFDLRDSL